jgi:shikimate dehydrogenase
LAYDDAEADAAISASRVVIDATTVGADPCAEPIVSPELLGAGQVVFDVNYGRGGSALLRAAQARGAQALDGLEMLIEQAALSIELWADEQGLRLSAPRDAMRAAALAECQRRGLLVEDLA